MLHAAVALGAHVLPGAVEAVTMQTTSAGRKQICSLVVRPSPPPSPPPPPLSGTGTVRVNLAGMWTSNVMHVDVIRVDAIDVDAIDVEESCDTCG